MSDLPRAEVSRPGPTSRIAITLGDPRGIGAEVTHKALAQLGGEERAMFVTVGPPQFSMEGVEHEPVGSWVEGAGVAAAGAVAALAIERATA